MNVKDKTLVKKLMDKLAGKIIFDAEMDYDSWIQDYVCYDIERQIKEELDRRGIPVSKVKNFNWKLTVEVELSGG